MFLILLELGASQRLFGKVVYFFNYQLYPINMGDICSYGSCLQYLVLLDVKLMFFVISGFLR